MLEAHAILQEIATQVAIDPDLTVRHALYPAWPLSKLVSQRLQDGPREIQAKFLCTQLQAYLHSIYGSRAIRPLTGMEPIAETSSVIMNNTCKGIDTAFYAQIDQANCSQSYYDPNWTIEREEDDGIVAVVKDGLRLHLPPQYIDPDYHTLAVGDVAKIVMLKNLLTIDRYIAVSNYGRVDPKSSLTLYFSCPPDTALALIAAITTALNSLKLPFELQVQIDPEQYQQTDSLILQLATADYPAAQTTLQDIYQPHRSHFYDLTPSFTQPLARGVGLTSLTTNEQGIWHLWSTIANSLAESWLLNITEPSRRIDRLWEDLESSEINNAAEVAGLSRSSVQSDIYPAW
jgi:hypothetical protein